MNNSKRYLNVGRWIVAVCFVFLGWNNGLVLAQDVLPEFEKEDSGASKDDEKLFQSAAEARKKSVLSLQSIVNRKNQFEKIDLKKNTQKQIRSQIDTMNELNSTVGQAAVDRKKRLIDLENEMNDILFQIRSLKKKKQRQGDEQPAKNMTQASSKQYVPSPNEKKNITQPELNRSTSMKSKSTLDSPDREFGSIHQDPVDRLSLANNLVAIEKYQTAIKILSALANDPTTNADELNWVHYQLARCYRRLQSFPEAEKHLREAANSKTREVARTTSIWWLEQMTSQKKMQESLDSMEKQLERLGQNDSNN